MLKKILDELKTGSKCILLHENADPDALGSAVALSLAFPEVSIGTVEGLNRPGKDVRNNLGVDVIEKPDLSDFDKIVVVDAPSPDRLGEYQNKLKKPIVIDHHSKTFNWDTDLCYVDENKASCAEIIYEILKLGDIKITRTMGLALLTSILSDTGKFSYATQDTFRTFGEIMDETGLSVNDVLSVFEDQHDTDYSRKISRLKGAQRLRYDVVNRYIISVSQISTFEASVCSALISLGANVSFVGSQRDDKFRISARTTHDLVELGLHLGNLMADIGEEIGGKGGGHDGAAGLSGTGDVEAVLNICMERTKSALSRIKRAK